MPKTFNYDTIHTLENKINALLIEFAKASDLVVSPVDIKFTETEFDLRARFSTIESNKLNVDPRFKLDLIKRGARLGLTPEMIGTKYTTESGIETIFVGMRATKIVLVDSKNNVYTADGAIAPRVISVYNESLHAA